MHIYGSLEPATTLRRPATSAGPISPARFRPSENVTMISRYNFTL